MGGRFEPESVAGLARNTQKLEFAKELRYYGMADSKYRYNEVEKLLTQISEVVIHYIDTIIKN